MTELNAREMLQRSPQFLAEMLELRNANRLGEAWRSILDGKGSKEDADMVFLDLMLETDYYGVAPEGANLERREGARKVMARILFLADLPTSFINRLRRDALDELQKLEV